jgi:hypothetical protein
MNKLIALALWACADALEIVRGGLLAAAVSLIDRTYDDAEQYAYVYPHLRKKT